MRVVCAQLAGAKRLQRSAGFNCVDLLVAHAGEQPSREGERERREREDNASRERQRERERGDTAMPVP